MFTPQRTYDVKWAFSTKQEAAYGTLVSDSHIDHAVGVIGTNVSEFSRTQYSDADRFGKGHEFPTLFRELTRDLKLSRTIDMSSLMAGWAAAFGMGNVVTTQPNSSNNPTAYQHVITFLNASSSKQAPVTTIYEQVTGQSSFERRLESMAVADFTISGRAREVCQLAVNLIGSGKETLGSLSVPGLSPVSILDMGGMTFKLGPQGAALDLSSRLADFQVKVSQQLDANNGYVPGGGIYRKRMWVGARQPSFDATVFVDSAQSDIMDDWANGGLLEVSFTLSGDVILNGQPEVHSCAIKFPAARLTAVPISASGDLLVYRISATPQDVYKDAGGTPNEPLQITVVNTEPSYLTT
jgi:hypothetical protein